MPQFRDEAGNIWDAQVDAQGNPIPGTERLVNQGQILPDPTAQYEAPKAAADVARTQAQTQGEAIDNTVAAGTAPTTIQTNQAPAGYMWVNPSDPTQGVRKIAGYEESRITPQIRSEALQAYKDAESLDRTIANLRRAYAQGPGSTSGIWGVQDYFPTATNSSFDTIGSRARGPIKRALGFTGGEGNTMAESAATYGPYTPTASDYDDTILEKIAGLEDLARSAREKAVATLGGVPDEAGNITPIDRPDPSLSALNQVRTDGGYGARTQAAGSDATTTTDEYPIEGQREHDQMVASLMSQNGGRLDPRAYAAARAQLDQKYNRQGDAAGYVDWATSVNDYLDAGGRTVPTGIQGTERNLSMTETLRNKAISNPVGAAAAGFANAGGFGVPGALLPDQAAAIADAYPLSSLGGEIGGAIAGTSMLGGAVRNTVGRAAPKLLSGGGKAQLARNVLTDAGYGAAYGTAQGGDPLTSAVLGAGGSLAGQAIGKGLGAGIGGIARSQPVQSLIDKGVTMSVGRQLGPGASRIEDLLQSVPLVGGRIRGRQEDSFRTFNEAAFREGAKPLSGFNPTAIGRDGLDQFDDAVGNAYTGALAGRSVPLDVEFNPSLQSAAQMRQALPDDVLSRADKLIDNHLGPIDQAGTITGEAYQKARRGLGKARNNANQIAGEFDNDYREMMTGVLDALDAQLVRGGGEDVIEGLNAANAANKNYNILENASLDRAKIGTGAGEVNVFTPSQLLTAARVSENKYGSDDLLRILGEEGQEVLPSTVPNSGTADRAMAAGALGTAGIGLPGLAGYSLGGVEGAQTGAYTGAGLAGALALLGTRGGQQLVQKALFDRPEIAQRVGREISGRRGLFGSAGVPVALQ